jgi:hypothetical protein
MCETCYFGPVCTAPFCMHELGEEGAPEGLAEGPDACCVAAAAQECGVACRFQSSDLALHVHGDAEEPLSSLDDEMLRSVVRTRGVVSDPAIARLFYEPLQAHSEEIRLLLNYEQRLDLLAPAGLSMAPRSGVECVLDEDHLLSWVEANRPALMPPRMRG